MPVRKGEVRVRYLHVGDKARFNLKLPEGMNGILTWSGQQYRLHGGEQELLLAAASHEQLRNAN
jgi:hypothetical protein